MNEELYEQLETEFLKYHIEDEVEDVLLELAEALADTGVIGRETTYKETLGRTEVEICGICETDEDDGDEVEVLVKWIKIGKKEFEIDDYLL